MSENANDTNRYFSDSSDADTVEANESGTNKNSAENEEIMEKYKTLKHDYDALVEEFDKLKLDYSENTIIQSMNDMKERYNELISTTVSVYRYKSLEKKYNTIHRACFSSLALLKHTNKTLGKLEMRAVYDPDKCISKAQHDIDTMHEIIEDAINETA